MKEIELDSLMVSQYNVRTNLGDIDELVKSIRSVGILEPLLVRPTSSTIFEIIIGQRRFHAARKAGLKNVPCVVREMSNEEAIVASLVENLQRGNLTEEEIAKAFLILHERNAKQWSQTEFAKRIGKSQPWISGILLAYQTLITLRSLGIVTGMKSHPTKKEKERGIAPVEHLKELEYALRSKKVTTLLSEQEITSKRVELAQAILGLPLERAKRVIKTFKISPRTRITEIVETLEGTAVQPAYTKAKASKQFKNPKSEFDLFVKNYREYIKLLENDAKTTPAKIPLYVNEVIPRLDPSLFNKIKLLTEDREFLVQEAVSHQSYTECIKNAIVKGKRLPKFSNFVHTALEQWLQKTIKNKRCSQAKPGVASVYCAHCSFPLEYNETLQLFCPNCKDPQELQCPICESQLTFKPPVSLLCELCGYRLQFSEPITPKISLKYACHCALENICDPRLKGKSLVMYRKQQDGTKKVIQVIASW